MNSFKGALTDKKKQTGAALVEFALTLPIFFMIVLTIFEIALLLFDWNRAVEATRAAARSLVVNDAPVDLSGIDCAGSPTSLTFTCAQEDCGQVLIRVQEIAPLLGSENIRITYQCTTAGYEDRPVNSPVFSLTAELEGFSSRLRIPSLVGFPSEIPMPDFSTTRITEDLHTP